MNTDTLILRKPTQEEVDKVYNYMYKYYKKISKITKKLKIVFEVLGIFFLIPPLAYGVGDSENLLAFILGFLSLVGAISAARSAKKDLTEADCFKNGNLFVADGIVSKIGISKHIGEVNIEIVNKYQETIPGPFSVNCVGVEVGTSVILVYLDKENSPDKQEFCWAFTEYMLNSGDI